MAFESDSYINKDEYYPEIQPASKILSIIGIIWSFTAGIVFIILALIFIFGGTSFSTGSSSVLSGTEVSAEASSEVGNFFIILGIVFAVIALFCIAPGVLSILTLKELRKSISITNIVFSVISFNVPNIIGSILCLLDLKPLPGQSTNNKN